MHVSASCLLPELTKQLMVVASVSKIASGALDKLALASITSAVNTIRVKRHRLSASKINGLHMLLSVVGCLGGTAVVGHEVDVVTVSLIKNESSGTRFPEIPDDSHWLKWTNGKRATIVRLR